jgi:hypothetical protein
MKCHMQITSPPSIFIGVTTLMCPWALSIRGHMSALNEVFYLFFLMLSSLELDVTALATTIVQYFCLFLPSLELDVAVATGIVPGFILLVIFGVFFNASFRIVFIIVDDVLVGAIVVRDAINMDLDMMDEDTGVISFLLLDLDDRQNSWDCIRGIPPNLP